MRITVRLFASLREKAGQDVLSLNLDEGATVADAWAQLCTRNETLAACRSHSLIALNRRYVQMNAALSEGDELALFPPVSGG